ncbi:MAG: hypothetical protein OXH23_05880 [bacterium]|nr:hypothetical protein [bacterium]
MAVTSNPTSSPQAEPPKSLLRIWRTPICGGAVVALGAASMVIWTHVTLFDLWPIGVAPATFLVLAPLDRGLQRLRRRGLNIWKMSTCAVAVVAVGIAVVVIGAGVTLSGVLTSAVNVLTALGVVLGLFFLVILLARGLCKLRRS